MQHDVIIIGGSFAGLAAALYLVRARRSVCVIDAGRPRNRFAAQSHGVFAQDGSSPQQMLATARTQVAAYPSVTFVQGSAVEVQQQHSGLAVTLATGEVLFGTTLLLAFGVSDVLPNTTGLEQRWGTSVIHCPYCHGYEFSGRQLGVLQLSPMSHHQAQLISEWGPTTYFLNGAEQPDAATLAEFARRNIRIAPAAIDALHGAGGDLSHVQLVDGSAWPIDALFIGPPTKLNSQVAEQLGCRINSGPFGAYIEVDDMKMTSVAGVYAAGDITRGGGHTVTFACADGVMAALAIHRALVTSAAQLERAP